MAEFRAQMVGRVALLAQYLLEGEGRSDVTDFNMRRSGAIKAVEWVQDRWPHLSVQVCGVERPDIIAPLLEAARQHHAEHPNLARRDVRPVVHFIEFEDDAQATEFKLRWV